MHVDNVGHFNAVKPHLVSQMVLCCVNVQRVIEVQKVLRTRQKKRQKHEGMGL